MNKDAHEIVIRSDLRPGDLGRLIALHGRAYEQEPGHFGLKFEALVARTTADFVLDNEGRGRVWLAERDGDLIGCAAMVDRGGRGQLRWVVLAPSERGAGLGKKLIGLAMDYAAGQDWREVYLETTPGLNASMAIYKKLGFKAVSEEPGLPWGGDDIVVTMVKPLR